jgi:hypothetical protein
MQVAEVDRRGIAHTISIRRVEFAEKYDTGIEALP